MIRVSYGLGRAEKTFAFDKPLVRFGRGLSCDLRIDQASASVGLHHGDLVLENGRYSIVDRGHGIWVDGERVQKRMLKGGENIHLGAPDGLALRILEVPKQPAPTRVEVSLGDVEDVPTVVVPWPSTPTLDIEVDEPTTVAPPQPAHPELAEPIRASATRLIPAAATKGLVVLKEKLKHLVKPHEDVEHWLSKAEAELAEARAGTPGISSGNTMVIMAKALSGLRQHAEGKTTRRWKRVLGWVLAASVVVMLGLSTVIWYQRQHIAQLAKEKLALDAQIEKIFEQMGKETDEQRLVELDASLQALMGKASDTVHQVAKTSASRAEELEKPVDALEEEIRKILKSFNAETYAIPPIFREALQDSIDEILASGGVQSSLARKQRYWPHIQKALRRKQLPEELGYIAYAESRFEPSAVNPRSRASGMWQFMEDPARSCGLIVNAKKDERFDPGRSSDGAACYLSRLLVEFGEESFMLALASYNRGENGVRRALHRLAREPGGYRKRDFWQLYRLKLLPEETREYVPKVLAAAIVLANPDKYIGRPSNKKSVAN